MTRKSYDGMI